MYPAPRNPSSFLCSPFLSLLLVAEVTCNKGPMNPGVTRALGVLQLEGWFVSSASLMRFPVIYSYRKLASKLYGVTGSRTRVSGELLQEESGCSGLRSRALMHAVLMHV